MVRVTSKSGHAIIITHGPPIKRMDDFKSFECYKEIDIIDKRINLSDLAQLINLLRSDLKDKPLKEAFQDKEYMLNAVKERNLIMILVMLIKKEEEFLQSSNPKQKMIGMLLKTRRIKEEQKKMEEAKKAAAEKGDTRTFEKSVPQRQDHCYMYLLTKKSEIKSM